MALPPGGPAKVSTWVPVPGAHPLASPDDCLEAEAIVKADPGVRKLLREVYGIDDVELVACDPWSGELPAPSTWCCGSPSPDYLA